MGWSFHNNVSSKNSSTNLQYNSTNEDKMRVVKCSKRPSNGIVLCECKCPKAWTKYSIDCFTKKIRMEEFREYKRNHSKIPIEKYFQQCGN